MVLMSRCTPNRGFLLRSPWLAVLPLLFGLPFLAGSYWPNFNSSQPELNPLTCVAVRQPFLHTISSHGEVESSKNVEVRCEVHSRDSTWVRILEVIPEGTRVKKGDFLMRLDASGLETDLSQQEIVCEQSKAAVVAARTKHEIALRAKQAYLDGEYRLAKEESETALLSAQNREEQSRQYLEASRKLYAKGFITAQQLQADEFALKAAQTDLKLAQLKLDLLERYTKPVKLLSLDTALATTKAKLKTAEYTSKINDRKLADIRKQIQRCIVRAPVEGEVVLAHLFHEGHAHMIEPGEMTAEKRTLVKLPDPKRMQVKAKIEEDKIALARPGLPVRIMLEAFPGLELPGKVVHVNEFPEPESWMSADTKQYEATIRIDAPLDGLRPGLSAQVNICVEQSEAEVQIPCQAVLKHGAKTYCITCKNGRCEAHEVALGPNNGQKVVIRSGIAEGQEVVLAPASYRDKVALPVLPRSAQQDMVATKQ